MKKSRFFLRVTLLFLLWIRFGFFSLLSAQGTNQPPNAQFDFFSVLEDIPFGSMVNPLTNDSDPENDNLSWNLVLGPFNGTLTVNNNGPSFYSNDLNYNGPDFFVYEVCDDGLPQLCATGFAVIIVLPTNDRPVASPDTFDVLEDTPSILDVVDNDFDADGDALYTQAVVLPKHGQLTQVGNTFRYIPDLNYFGPDSFRYQLSDSSLFGFLSPRTWVRIQVLPVNDPPVAHPDSIPFPQLDQVAELLIENDTDVENDVLIVNQIWTSDESLTAGNLMIDSTGVTLNYFTAPCGTDTFEYVVCDNQGGCDTAVVFVTGPTCEEQVTGVGLLPEGISPNGDGINDRLVFPWLDIVQPPAIKVFNRWGNLVYASEAYDNSWSGTNTESGEGLPDGSYFYILRLFAGTEYIRSLIIHR